jgi:hypothetical protein
MTQLRAIEILLRKSIPDLAAAEIKSEQTHRYVVEMPPELDRDQWQRKYGQQSGAVGAATVPGVRSAGRTARDPETIDPR